MPITRRAGLAGIVGSISALAAPHVARAAPRPLRLGYNNPDDAHYGQGARVFSEAVATHPILADVLRIRTFGNAELGDEIGMLQACLNGTLDMMICSGAVSGNAVPEFGVVNAPFLFRDTAHARAVFDGPVAAELSAVGLAAGLHVLAWGENGMRHVTANRPVQSLADFHGLHIRVPQSRVMEAGLKSIGADPGQLSFTMLREALRTGEFEAEENPIVIIEAIKLYELQSCLSLTAHVYDPALFAASTDVIDDLTEPQAAALRACAARGAAKTREVAAAAEQNGLARLRTAGMRVIDVVQTGDLRSAAQPYLATLKRTYGSKVPSLFAAHP